MEREKTRFMQDSIYDTMLKPITIELYVELVNIFSRPDMMIHDWPIEYKEEIINQPTANWNPRMSLNSLKWLLKSGYGKNEYPNIDEIIEFIQI